MINRNKNVYSVLPYSAVEEAGATDVNTGTAPDLDSLLNSFDDKDTNDSNAGDTEPPATPPEDTPPAEQNKEPAANDKTNYAFAQMRNQISTSNALLEKLAKANGIEYANLDDLAAKLNDDALEKMAKKQNVPVELVKEVDSLKQTHAMWQMQQREQVAYQGFQHLIDSYGLSQDKLNAFAVELDGAGKNPFTQDVNIIDEYKVRHFDEIIQAQTEKAVKEALAKSNVADQHSTTPNPQQGSNSSANAEKITTQEGLSKFLKQMD